MLKTSIVLGDGSITGVFSSLPIYKVSLEISPEILKFEITERPLTYIGNY